MTESYILVGAGLFGKKVVEGLHNNGIEPLAFCDIDPMLIGKTIHGIRVLSQDEAVDKYSSMATFVITMYKSKGIVDIFKKLGCKNVITYKDLFQSYKDSFPSLFSLLIPKEVYFDDYELIYGASLWADAKSREEYTSQVAFRFTLDETILHEPSPENEMYFPKDIIKLTDEEVFVDCGAYDGDSIKQFLEQTNGKFKKIFAIEPDPNSIYKAVKYIGTLPADMQDKISIVPFAVGKKEEGTVPFQADGVMGSRISSDGNKDVTISTLDTLIDHMPATFIKMDIEGAELDALIGAKRILKEFQPSLAICLYHKYDDFLKIPLYIKKVNPSYKLYLRRYAEYCWDLVCYAVPEKKE